MQHKIRTIICLWSIFLIIVRSSELKGSCGIADNKYIHRQKGIVTESPYPWFVALIQTPLNSKTLSQRFCMGSIISARDVLTAAHCATRDLFPFSIVINIGQYCYSDNLETHSIQVKKSILHPLYQSKKPWYDFAILRLSKSVDIMPICLPSSNDLLTKYGIAVVMNTTDCHQIDLVMPVFSTLECLRMLRRKTYFFDLNTRYIQAGFCAGYLYDSVDTCQGDSGGPFQAPSVQTNHYTVLGVTSFGFGCKIDNTLGVYADVRDVVWWIREVVAARTFVRGQ